MPESLVEEIQRAAIDSKSEVSTLLRKVKLAAAKLQLDTIEQWVEQELNGYPNGVELPSYRKLRGSPLAQTVYHGWQPFQVGKNMEFLLTANIGESIASLETIIGSNEDSVVRLFPPSVATALFKANEGQVMQAGCSLQRSSFVGILNAVRNLVLDWAIKMEKAGVQGQGFSFSPGEQTSAQKASAVFNIHSIGSFNGTLGVANVSGDITSAPLNIEQVKNLISQVKSHAQGLTNEGVNGGDLSAAISSLEKAVEAKKPDLIRTGLNELQKVVAKTAGGLLAHGVLGLMHKILATGIPNV